MSRIFARSSSTSMAQECYPPGPRGAIRKTASASMREVRNQQVGLGRRPAEARGVVRGPHADAVRPDHVGVRVVADVHRLVRRHPGALQRDVEDPGLRLAEADLVGVGDRAEVAEQPVALEHPAQDHPRRAPGVGDDAEAHAARGQLPHRAIRARTELRRMGQHRADVAVERRRERGGIEARRDARAPGVQHDPELLVAGSGPVEAPEALGQRRRPSARECPPPPSRSPGPPRRPAPAGSRPRGARAGRGGSRAESVTRVSQKSNVTRRITKRSGACACRGRRPSPRGARRWRRTGRTH